MESEVEAHHVVRVLRDEALERRDRPWDRALAEEGHQADHREAAQSGGVGSVPIFKANVRSFSAVSAPIFASKYALFNIF